MGRHAVVLFLLAGCSTPPPPPATPLTAEETYERIREVFLNAPSAGFKFWPSGRPWEPSSIVFASGNRVRITRRAGSQDDVIATNGDQAMNSVDNRGTQPDVFKVPPDFGMTLRRDLLRGLLTRVSSRFGLNTRDASLRNYVPYSDHKGSTGFSLGTDETGKPSLSFRVYRPGFDRPDDYVVKFRYDPGTYALLRIESHPPKDRYEYSWDLVAELDPALPATDDLFVIPEDPKIRIEATKADLARIREALERYLIDNHAYPTTVQSLDALVREPQNPRPLKWKGPYLKVEAPVVDAWGRPYSYHSPRPKINPEGYDLWSWGWDGKSGNGDDLKR